MSETRETTILFANMIGAADLYAKAGDSVAHDAIAMCLKALAAAAEGAGARVAKTMREGLMVLAAQPDAAADAAAGMHGAVEKMPALAQAGITVGIGFHFGPVIQQGTEVFGDSVTLASRLAEQAASAQILLDEETGRRLAPLYRAYMRKLGPIRIKDRSVEVKLCELVWRADDNATAMAPKRAPEPAARVELALTFNGKRSVYRRDKENIIIGRGDDCAVQLQAEHASRHHCRIERRKDKFVLIDTSANGTYVTVEGEKELLLQREEFVLRKHGWIHFGDPANVSKEVLEFSCE